MSPCVSGAAPGFDMAKTRSLDLTSKILKDRSPASTRSPIPPSGSVWAIRSAAGFGARCLEAPDITSPLPSFPPPAEEHAEEISKAATNTASIMAFFMGVSASSLGRPRRARLYDGQPRSYRRVAGCTNHAVLTLSSPQRTLRQHPGLACQETSTQGGRGQGVPVWIQRVEEGAPDGEDAALRYPEITEPCLRGKRPKASQISIRHPGRAGPYRPDARGVDHEPLVVGHPASQTQASCPQHNAGCFSHRVEYHLFAPKGIGQHAGHGVHHARGRGLR